MYRCFRKTKFSKKILEKFLVKVYNLAMHL